MCVQTLLEYRAPVNVPKHNGATPLWAAAYRGHEAVARVLINAGADVSMSRGETSPLWVAAQCTFVNGVWVMNWG